MLLLLFTADHIEDCQKIPNSTNTYALHDLFDINLGLMEDRFINITKVSKEPVMFLKLSTFFNDKNENSTIKLTTFENQNLVDWKKVEIKHQESEVKNMQVKNRKPIPDHKVLKACDYLITLRGRPKGYSMLHSISPNQPKVVSSNHFIHIRPRQMQLEEMHIPYLHLLLDLIVEKKLMTNFDAILEKLENDKKYGIFNAFKIQDLRDMQIQIPRNRIDQEKAFGLFLTNYEQYLQANLKFDQFKSCLSNKII